MLYIERREKILEMLRKSGNVKVSDLVDIFHVDATNIRRDLKALADNEKVKTVYGGAYYINEMSQWPIEDNPDVKRTINIEKKQIVAQKAAKEIKNGDTIILNNGVTAELILDYLPEMKSLNLITQSLIIAQKAVEKQFIDVYLPGGKYRKKSGMFYGDFAIDAIKKFRASKIFLGILGVSIHDGVTHPAIEEVPVMQALLEISHKKYLIADTTKYGKAFLGKIAGLSEFDTLIVDEELPEIYYKYAEEHGIRII